MKSAGIAFAVAASSSQRAIEGFAYRQPLKALSPRTLGSGQQASSPYLTPRQLEVLSSLCEGLPNKEIARRLNISAATVKVHIGSILRELGVANRLQAVISAHGLGSCASLG